MMGQTRAERWAKEHATAEQRACLHGSMTGRMEPPRRAYRLLGISFGPWVPGHNRGWCLSCGLLLIDRQVLPARHPDRLRGPFG